MNPEIPRTPREEMEARLTALILGELPAEQAFALGRTIEQDAELAKLYSRLKDTIGLVREAEPVRLIALRLSHVRQDDRYVAGAKHAPIEPDAVGSPERHRCAADNQSVVRAWRPEPAWP